MPPQGSSKRSAGTSNQDEDRPIGKRSRVSRACDQCRTAREKCDGRQPICLTCSSAKRPCTYTSPAKKRGIQPGYIRTLELALTWLFQQNADIETLLNRKLAQDGATSVLLARDSKDSNKLHRSWRRSKFCKDVDKLLSGGEIGVNANEGRSPDSDDETDAEESHVVVSGARADVHLRQQTSLNMDTSRSEHPSVAPSTTSTSQDLSGTPKAQQPISNLSLLQQTSASLHLPPNTWRLFDIYFAYTQSWLPISEKNDVLKLSYSYPEQGLNVSSSSPESGLHAELWSIFALASVQETLYKENDAQHDIHSTTSERMYEIARALIPSELGSFTIGHVKALLNLATVNLSRAAPEAAWLLIGLASRVFSAIQASAQFTDPRRKHVLAACFVLDTLVSIQLCRLPHFQRSNIVQSGRVEEDGLEEWQPWHGCFSTQTSPQTRTPALGLSTFNNLTEIVGLLGLYALPGTSISTQDIQSSIDAWRTSLSPQFDFIRLEREHSPPTPQAFLLQLVYCCSTMVAYSSPLWAQRTLEVLEKAQGQLGIPSTPPLVHSIFEIFRKNKVFDLLDERLRMRFHGIRAEFHRAWMLHSKKSSVGSHGPVNALARQSLNTVQIPNTELIPMPLTSFMTVSNPSGNNGRLRTSSTLLDDLLPDMNVPTISHHHPMNIQNYNFPQFEGRLNPPPPSHNQPAAYRDIENFFDELASLDDAEKVVNQPQFMQNLGFAPDANMADFLATEFSQFVPLQSSTFVPENGNATQMDHSSLYDGG